MKWLFVRGVESVWIERPNAQALLIAGPGAARERRTFSTGHEADAYQTTYTNRLTKTGWVLLAFDHDRRAGHDRRGTARRTTDRRRGVNSTPVP
jgi:hypothetical protein